MTEQEKEYLKNFKKENNIRSLKRLAKLEKLKDREFYNNQSILSYSLAIFYFLLGGRETGKSYSVTDTFCNQWKKYKRPFYWLRLTEDSAKKLLMNNAEKLIDPDLRRKYKLDLKTIGSDVFEIKRNEKGKIISKNKMCTVLALNTFYSNKGNGFFDKDFLNNPKMFYNICLDEMNREQSERKTFDIVYAFFNQIENIIRSTKSRLRIVCIGNTLSEASDILGAFNFIPEKFGRYVLIKNRKKLREYLKLCEIPFNKRTKQQKERYKELSKIDYGKRAVIEYMEPNEAYSTRRKNTVADIISGKDSTLTNKIELDYRLITKERLIKPIAVIMFTKQKKYTIWNNNVIADFNNEKVNTIIAMRPYLDEMYNKELKNQVLEQFDNRGFRYHSMIVQTKFKNELSLLRKQ